MINNLPEDLQNLIWKNIFNDVINEINWSQSKIIFWTIKYK